MAKCAYCGKSGWFLSIDRHKLCRSCSPVVGAAVTQHLKVISDSDRIVENTTNRHTRLIRLKTILQHCEILQYDYIAKGVIISDKPLEPVIDQVHRRLRDAIADALAEIVATARRKSADGISETTKITPYNKAIEDVNKLLSQGEYGYNIVNEIETALRNERDDLRFKLLTDRAEVEIIKNKPKKAAETYIDAISSVQNNARFFERIAIAKQRLNEIGGRPQSPRQISSELDE